MKQQIYRFRFQLKGFNNTVISQVDNYRDFIDTTVHRLLTVEEQQIKSEFLVPYREHQQFFNQFVQDWNLVNNESEVLSLEDFIDKYIGILRLEVRGERLDMMEIYGRKEKSRTTIDQVGPGESDIDDSNIFKMDSQIQKVFKPIEIKESSFFSKFDQEPEIPDECSEKPLKTLEGELESLKMMVKIISTDQEQQSEQISRVQKEIVEKEKYFHQKEKEIQLLEESFNKREEELIQYFKKSEGSLMEINLDLGESKIEYIDRNEFEVNDTQAQIKQNQNQPFYSNLELLEKVQESQFQLMEDNDQVQNDENDFDIDDADEGAISHQMDRYKEFYSQNNYMKFMQNGQVTGLNQSIQTFNKKVDQQEYMNIIKDVFDESRDSIRNPDLTHNLVPQQLTSGLKQYFENFQNTLDNLQNFQISCLSSINIIVENQDYMIAVNTELQNPDSRQRFLQIDLVLQNKSTKPFSNVKFTGEKQTTKSILKIKNFIKKRSTYQQRFCPFIQPPPPLSIDIKYWVNREIPNFINSFEQDNCLVMVMNSGTPFLPFAADLSFESEKIQLYLPITINKFLQYENLQLLDYDEFIKKDLKFLFSDELQTDTSIFIRQIDFLTYFPQLIEIPQNINDDEDLDTHFSQKFTFVTHTFEQHVYLLDIFLYNNGCFKLILHFQSLDIIAQQAEFIINSFIFLLEN